jgi:two-component system sensor histidine kinase KdpD
MAPEGLRRRMAHGNVYGAEKVDAALSNYFRIGNLTALRELALLWLAGRVDEGLRRYRAEHDIRKVWETRETVVVALTGGPEGETLIRRAARIADRAGSDALLAVHVARSDGLADVDPGALAAQRGLVEQLGGTFHSVVGDNIPTALLDFARASNATQLVIGTSRRSALRRALTAGRGIGETTIELSGDIDVHMVTHEQAGRTRLPFVTNDKRSTPAGRSIARHWAGLAGGLILPPLLTLMLTQTRGTINLTSDTLLFLALVVGISLLGGIASALVASLVASILLNYYFIPPIHKFTIAQPNNVLALVVFAIVAIVVAAIVDTARKQSGRAARATAEAETLSALAGSVLRGDQAVPALLDRLRETFGMESVDLVDGVPQPAAGEEVVPVGGDAALILRGRPLPASDRRVLAAFAAHVAVALERTRLAEVAAEVEPVKAADRLRTALLAAVSHDLRTPLAVALASVSSLRSDDVEFTPEEQADLLVTAEESLSRLSRLVENLLDMSRLQAGALSLDMGPTAIEDVWSGAIGSLPEATTPVEVQGLDQVPPVLADAPLLERVLANLVSNAQRHAPGSPLLVSASALADTVQVRVVDRGPGLPEGARDRVFQPFQRLGDTDNATGVGLGLALARGLTEAMGGTLTPEDTPGGGLTMVLTLPVHPLDEDGLPEHEERPAGPYSESSPLPGEALT